MSKTARLEEKLAKGLDKYEAEIEMIREDLKESISKLRVTANRKIERLQASRDKELAQVQQKLLDQLRSEDPDGFADRLQQARESLAPSVTTEVETQIETGELVEDLSPTETVEDFESSSFVEEIDQSYNHSY